MKRIFLLCFLGLATFGGAFLSTLVTPRLTAPSLAMAQPVKTTLDVQQLSNTFETVVCETPVRPASRRRLGQPARWCRSWSASTSSRWGPGATSGRGSAPIAPASLHP